MKRTWILFLVIGLVLVSTGVWFFTSQKGLETLDILHLGIILLIIGFALFIGIKRLGSARRGEPEEDELSKRILQRTAAISYYVSLYLWLFLLFLKDRVKMDSEQLLGTGILGMAIVFGISWMVLNFKGLKNG